MKSNSWHRLIMFGREYVFGGIIKPGTQRDAFMDLLNVVAELVEHVSDAAHDAKEEKASQQADDALQKRVVEALCQFGACVPATEHASVFHELLHVVQAVHRWGSVRNFWCYGTERSICAHFITICAHLFRFMGFLIRHIHSRKNPNASIVKGMSVRALIRLAPSDVQSAVCERRGRADFHASSSLGSAKSMMYASGGKVGEGLVYFKSGFIEKSPPCVFDVRWPLPWR
jgi:hypothetical protein